MRDQPNRILNSPRGGVPLTASAPLTTSTLRAVAAPLPRTAIAIGALLFAGELSAQTPLSVGRTLSGSLSEGDTARYTFEAGEDYFVLGEVDR